MTGTIVGTIHQGETKTHQLYMEGNEPIAFSLYHGTENLKLTLISPDGIRIYQADASTGVENSLIGDVDGYRIEMYAIKAPQPGMWTLEVTALSVTNPGSVEEPYYLNGYLTNSPNKFSVHSDKYFYHSGETVSFYATLQDTNIQVTGANVTVKVAIPDETTNLATLADDGNGDDVAACDGLYSGRMTTWTISGSGECNRADRFSIHQGAIIAHPVSDGSSGFNHNFSDSGYDNNGDGLFNELVVNVGFNILTNGNCRIFGQLNDVHGALVGTTGLNTIITTGTQQISLRFDGEPKQF